jgi:BON domain-containing protein
MKPSLCLLVLLCALTAIGQQQSQPPPESTPPTFPREQDPREQMPPDQQAPARPLSTPEVQQQIQQSLDSEPMLRGSDVAVHVDENSVILSGTVETEEQHDVVLRITQSYAGERKIVDKVKLTQKT